MTELEATKLRLKLVKMRIEEIKVINENLEKDLERAKNELLATKRLNDSTETDMECLKRLNIPLI